MPQPPPPRDFERDLQIAEAITHDLKEYLLNDLVYMELGRRGFFGQQYPKGTLGGLLFRLDYLQNIQGLLTSQQVDRLGNVRQRADELLRQWGVQAEQKAAREIPARLRTWENFLEEASEDPQRHNVEYAAQVENRVVIEYLRQYAEHILSDDLRNHVNATDQRLGRIASSGDFVWSESLEAALPSERFPWLYMKLR